MDNIVDHVAKLRNSFPLLYTRIWGKLTIFAVFAIRAGNWCGETKRERPLRAAPVIMESLFDGRGDYFTNLF